MLKYLRSYSVKEKLYFYGTGEWKLEWRSILANIKMKVPMAGRNF